MAFKGCPALIPIRVSWATWLALLLLSLTARRCLGQSVGYNEKCSRDSECKNGLVCRLKDNVLSEITVCRCGRGLQWASEKCMNKDEIDSEKMAELITILIPVGLSVLLVSLA